MHVVQVAHVYHPSFGGIENYVHRLNETLRSDGHTVTTVTTDLSFSPDSPVRPEEDTLYCDTTFSVYRNPFSAELFRRLKRIDADVYHLHSPWFLPSVEAVLALPDDAPIVMTIHGVQTPNETLPARLLNAAYWPVAQYVLSRVDRVVVLGEPERDRLHGRFRVPRDRVVAIPNGIAPAEYDVPEAEIAAFHETVDIDPDLPTVLYVGRLVPVKQPDVLVEAVTDHLPDADLQVLVVGKGEPGYVADLRRAADDRIRFRSNLTFRELKAAYHAADVFVSIGASEGLSTVLLEAMNARLPVVTTPAGATTDVVSDPENGRVLDLHPSPASLATAIRTYLDDPDERRAVGERNRELVRERFTWDGVYRDLLALYEELIGDDSDVSR